MTGGERVARILRAHGVGSVFALAGASHTHLLDPLDRLGIRIVSSRHESGAVGAADGYARVMGDGEAPRVGVALIVGDQGLPNAIGGLAVAHHANSPVVVIVAVPPRGFAETDTAIDMDQLALVAPLTRWARAVPAAARLADHVIAAIRHARAGARGPTVLLVPQDQFRSEVLDAPALGVPAAPHALPAAADVARAADMIVSSKRVAVVCGAGAFRGRATLPLRLLAYDFGLPVLGNGQGRGLVAEDGEIGFSWPFAQPAIASADCVIVVGARLTQRLGFGLPPRFAPDVRIVQIDADPRAFDRNRPTDVPLLGEAGPTLERLVAALRERGMTKQDNGWLHRCLADRVQRTDELKALATDPTHPLALGARLAARIPDDAVVVGDGADIQNWMYSAVRIKRPGGFTDHYPMGAMGSGTPLAVGAAAALAELADDNGSIAPPVVLITGDGSIGFYPAELHAAARARLDVKIIVGNDGAWGTEAHGQVESIGRTVNTELGVLPYARLAEAFGCRGLTCDRTAALDASLDALFACDGPALLDVRLDRNAGAELKSNAAVSTIVFSDLNEGRNALEGGTRT